MGNVGFFSTIPLLSWPFLPVFLLLEPLLHPSLEGNTLGIDSQTDQATVGQVAVIRAQCYKRFKDNF